MLLGHLANADLALPTKAADFEISGLCADSRTVAPGDLFAALPGTATDGATGAGGEVAGDADGAVASTVAGLDEGSVVVDIVQMEYGGV